MYIILDTLVILLDFLGFLMVGLFGTGSILLAIGVLYGVYSYLTRDRQGPAGL